MEEKFAYSKAQLEKIVHYLSILKFEANKENVNAMTIVYQLLESCEIITEQPELKKEVGE